MINQIREIVETHLQNNWIETPISFENVHFEQQDGQPFIEVMLMPDSGEQASLGDNNALNRWTGSILIGVHVPIGQGSAAAFRLADNLLRLFYHFKQGGFFTLTGNSVPSGETGSWYKVDVSIPYQYDEVM